MSILLSFWGNACRSPQLTFCGALAPKPFLNHICSHRFENCGWDVSMAHAVTVILWAVPGMALCLAISTLSLESFHLDPGRGLQDSGAACRVCPLPWPEPPQKLRVTAAVLTVLREDFHLSTDMQYGCKTTEQDAEVSVARWERGWAAALRHGGRGTRPQGNAWMGTALL